MSGHSKWANIKHRKEKSDSKKGKVFTKLGREIAVIVKQGGADPESNGKLRDVIAKAKAANMPNDSIMRSIKKASGEGAGSSYEEITYEGYGPGGVAVIVEALTDSRNRTAGDVRHIFDKYGGNLGTTGCVSFMFNRRGLIIIEREAKQDEDDVMADVLEAGADDFDAQDDVFEILTTPESFSEVRQMLESKRYSFSSAGIEMIPVTTTKLGDAKHMENMEKLIDALDDLDDVQNIFHNLEDGE